MNPLYCVRVPETPLWGQDFGLRPPVPLRRAPDSGTQDAELLRTGAAMYIKATKTHSKAGAPAYSHRLVLASRVDGKVRHRTLLNLGTDFAVARDRWGELASLAEDLLHGRVPLIDADAEMRAAAEDIVRRLRARGFRAEALREEAREPDIATVDLDSLAHENPRSAGCERLCLKALDDLAFEDILRGLDVAGRDARIAAGLLVARMLHPSSEREASRWLRADSATAELLGLEGDRKALSRKTLYRVGDILWRNREAIQAELFQRERSLLDIPGSIVFYDLSNAFYHGRHNAGLMRFGRSKQKRNDLPLVSLALALDDAGFPRSCEILPGNVSEPETLEEAMARLDAACGPQHNKPTVVMDAGIASAANLKWLRKHGYHWVVVSRGAKPPRPEGAPELALTTAADHEVRAWRLAEEAGEVRLYVVSEGKKLTEDSILAKKRERFTDALDKLHAGLSIPGRLKRYEKVLESVGRIKQRHTRVARHFEVTVEKAAKGANASAVRYRRKPLHDAADEQAGAYVLRTSRTEWDSETILRTYWKITEVEQTFRSLKSELGLRPIFHQLDRRIAAHLFIAVLAYHAVHLIRTRLAAKGIHLCWSSIRTRMAPWVRVTTRLREVGGALIVNRQDVSPGAELAALSRAAGVEPRIHRQRSRTGG